VKLAIGVVSPPNYVHSQAFREVAETLEAAAIALGHDVVVSTETNLPNRRTIVLGTNLLVRHPQPLGPDAILYNLEQVQAGPWFDGAMVELLKRYQVWDYSVRNADALELMGVPRPKVVPVGWVPELNRIPKCEEDIDVLFYGSINPRRRAIIEALRRANLRVETLFGTYGRERDAYIARSKLVLNVHYYESKVFEIVRVSYLLANGRAVVSERGGCPEEEAQFEPGVAFANYEELVQRCIELLAAPQERAAMALRGQKLMEARPMTEALRRALDDNQNAPFVTLAAMPTRFGRDAVAVRFAAPEKSEEPRSIATAIAAYYQCSRPEIVDFVPVQGKAVLDVGCAAGAMGGAMLDRGAREVVGIELNSEAAQVARCRLTSAYQYDLDLMPALPYPFGYFDVITFADVLEHLRDPARVVRHLLNWCKPGGTIVCSIPNVRHQSVLLPLLVKGEWAYEDAGILDRTHLRFFTLNGIKQFCAELGLALGADMRLVSTPAAPELEPLCVAVKALGGDVALFREEAQIVQYIFSARVAESLAADTPKPIVDPWRGSRPTRLLIAPNLDDPNDSWERLLMALATTAQLSEDVTVGIALPRRLLGEPPLIIHQAAATGSLDLVLTEAPLDVVGMTRLFGGTSIWMPTSHSGDLRQIAQSVGVKVVETTALLRAS